MFALITSVALATSASPVSAASDEPKPVIGSLSGIVTADDYPADALDLNQQGTVGVLVRVDATGAVSDCVITTSSGSPALDAQTCRLVWLRAKFVPAKDASGKPVASTYRQRINWRIGGGADDGAANEPWMLRWIASGWDNGVPSCRSELGGLSESESAALGQCPAYVAGVAASLSGSVAGYRELVVEQRFSVGTPPVLAMAPSDRFTAREVAQLDIDAAGRVSSCKVLETSGLVPPQIPRACLISAKQYTPKKDSRGSPVPFTAFFATEVYAHNAK